VNASPQPVSIAFFAFSQPLMPFDITLAFA
jgi:hypothetical protein